MRRIRLTTAGTLTLLAAVAAFPIYSAYTHEVRQRQETQAIVTKKTASVDRCFKEKGVPILSLGAVVCLNPCDVKWIE